MTRAWLEVGGQPAYHRLCAAIVALARAGVARLTARDGDPLLAPPSAQFASRVSELQAAWHAAEAVVPGGGPLGRLARLLRKSDAFVEGVLFALTAAPALDRGIAIAYRALEPGGAAVPSAGLSAGLLLDLTSTVDTHRFALAAALHPDAALRRSGLVRAGLRPDEIVGAASPVEVASTALAVLRCEPVPPPTGATELWPAPPAGGADRALRLLGVPLLERGQVTTIVDRDAPAGAAVAIARLLAASDGCGLWVVPLADRAEPVWLGLVRDAALANVVALVRGPLAGPWFDRLAETCARAMASIVCALPSAPVRADDVAAIDLADAIARAPDVSARADDAAVDALVRALLPATDAPT